MPLDPAPTIAITTVVAVFADASAARSAADALVRSGISPADVHLHEKGMTPRNASGVLLDEYATGGFFTNFAHLLDGLLGAPRASPSYEEIVQFEGSAVSVQVHGSDEAVRVEKELRAAGARKVASGA
jgi:hypothetical protein